MAEHLVGPMAEKRAEMTAGEKVDSMAVWLAAYLAGQLVGTMAEKTAEMTAGRKA